MESPEQMNDALDVIHDLATKVMNDIADTKGVSHETEDALRTILALARFKNTDMVLPNGEE